MIHGDSITSWIEHRMLQSMHSISVIIEQSASLSVQVRPYMTNMLSTTEDDPSETRLYRQSLLVAA